MPSKNAAARRATAPNSGASGHPTRGTEASNTSPNRSTLRHVSPRRDPPAPQTRNQSRERTAQTQPPPQRLRQPPTHATTAAQRPSPVATPHPSAPAATPHPTHRNGQNTRRSQPPTTNPRAQATETQQRLPSAQSLNSYNLWSPRAPPGQLNVPAVPPVATDEMRETTFRLYHERLPMEGIQLPIPGPTLATALAQRDLLHWSKVYASWQSALRQSFDEKVRLTYEVMTRTFYQRDAPLYWCRQARCLQCFAAPELLQQHMERTHQAWLSRQAAHALQRSMALFLFEEERQRLGIVTQELDSRRSVLRRHLTDTFRTAILQNPAPRPPLWYPDPPPYAFPPNHPYRLQALSEAPEGASRPRRTRDGSPRSTPQSAAADDPTSVFRLAEEDIAPAAHSQSRQAGPTIQPLGNAAPPPAASYQEVPVIVPATPVSYTQSGEAGPRPHVQPMMSRPVAPPMAQPHPQEPRPGPRGLQAGHHSRIRVLAGTPHQVPLTPEALAAHATRYAPADTRAPFVLGDSAPDSASQAAGPPPQHPSSPLSSLEFSSQHGDPFLAPPPVRQHRGLPQAPANTLVTPRAPPPPMVYTVPSATDTPAPTQQTEGTHVTVPDSSPESAFYVPSASEATPGRMGPPRVPDEDERSQRSESARSAASAGSARSKTARSNAVTVEERRKARPHARAETSEAASTAPRRDDGGSGSSSGDDSPERPGRSRQQSSSRSASATSRQSTAQRRRR